MPLRVQCDNCASTYTLPDSRLTPGRRVQFQCRHCQHRILVSVPEGGIVAVGEGSLVPQGGSALTLGQPMTAIGSIVRGRGAGAPLSAAAAAPHAPISQAAAARVSQPIAPDRAAQPLAAARTSQPIAARPAVAPTPPNIMWFVASPSGQQQRLGTDGLRAAIAAGDVRADTLLWRKGFAEWQRAGDTADWGPAIREADSMAGRTASSATRAKPVAAGLGHNAAGLGHNAAGLGHNAAGMGQNAHGMGQNAAAASVARGESGELSQRAIALPVVRVAVATAGADASDPVSGGHAALGVSTGGARRPLAAAARPDSSALRPAPAGPRGARTPDVTSQQDAVDDGASVSRWSPATDTYTGPRGKLTRRVGDEARDVLRVFEQETDPRGVDVEPYVRPWRMLAVGALCAAFVALAMAVFLVLRWRAAAAELEACRSGCQAPTAVTAPAPP
ncbi:MAG: hypothetical protein EXR79_04940 [Myxococcales bacterium]|nr:hypothetical protein [Myxococcales bacterium]